MNLKINQVKLKFFDSRLLSAADKARYRVLTYAGGYIRKTSKNMQKSGERTEVSEPGQPPLYHRQSPVRYKDLIFYHVEKAEGKMYCGAHLLNGRGGHKVPKALEYGGPSLVWTGTGANRRQVTKYIRPRPHMRAAMEKFVKQEQKKLLQNSIRAY